MSEKRNSINNYKNYEYENLIAKTLRAINNTCPECDTTNQLSSLVIMCNESFIFNYNDLSGVELKFNHR